MQKKCETIRIRVTPEEHQALVARAGGKGKVSAFVRKLVLGRENETTFALARIHGTALQIARALGDRDEPLPVSLALAHLLTVERHLHDFLHKGTP